VGSGGIAPPFLTSSLEGGEWSVSRPGRFTPDENSTGTHWLGEWVGPRAGLDAVEKIKILPLPEFEARVNQSVARRYTDSKYTVMCCVVHASKITGSSSDDWIY
jgi:hypothetical protein